MPAPDTKLMRQAMLILKEGEESARGAFGRDVFADSFMDDEILVQCLAGALQARGPVMMKCARDLVAAEGGTTAPPAEPAPDGFMLFSDHLRALERAVRAARHAALSEAKAAGVFAIDKLIRETPIATPEVPAKLAAAKAVNP